MTVWKALAPEPGAFPGPVLFLDRDGVVIAEENYLADPGRVRVLPGVIQAMTQARSAGFLLVGVSNQSGIGRGFFSEQEFHKVMGRLDELLAEGGVGFDAFHYCPHAPEETCSCRKPRPGLLLEAQAVRPIDLAQSWMVGDKNVDVAFGRGAGLGCVLVLTGHGKSEEAAVRQQWGDDPRVLVAADLPAAINLILEFPIPSGPA